MCLVLIKLVKVFKYYKTFADATKQQTLREFYEAKKKQLKENFEMMLEVYRPELSKTLGQIVI